VDARAGQAVRAGPGVTVVVDVIILELAISIKNVIAFTSRGCAVNLPQFVE
jgi:hypothetical protein